MSTAFNDGCEEAEGTLMLSSIEKKKKFVMGYELGLCPGADIHLGLRFQGKPATGVDGTAFPAALWEQSPKFTLPGQHISLAGVGAFASKRDVMRANFDITEASPLDAKMWKAALAAHMNVTATYFVVHDTAGGGVPASAKGVNADARGVHLFLNMSTLYLNKDFSANGTATKFEQRHKEFRGTMIHVEHAYPPVSAQEDRSPNPPPPPGGYNYDALALAYIFASYRAKRWLTVTCHLELDRGIPNGHHDPRGFSFATFYKKIVATVGGPPLDLFKLPELKFPIEATPKEALPTLPSNATFGILDERMGDGLNRLEYLNTFPAQYGPVQKAPAPTKSASKKKKKK